MSEFRTSHKQSTSPDGTIDFDVVLEENRRPVRAGSGQSIMLHVQGRDNAEIRKMLDLARALVGDE